MLTARRVLRGGTRRADAHAQLVKAFSEQRITALINEKVPKAVVKEEHERHVVEGKKRTERVHVECLHFLEVYARKRRRHKQGKLEGQDACGKHADHHCQGSCDAALVACAAVRAAVHATCAALVTLECTVNQQSRRPDGDERYAQGDDSESERAAKGDEGTVGDKKDYAIENERYGSKQD